jgi:hypothetical protein
MRQCRNFHVQIPIKAKGNNTFENIRKAEHTLSKKGIWFDSGVDLALGKIRSIEWELDWSLEGAKPNAVLMFLKKENIKAIVKCKR